MSWLNSIFHINCRYLLLCYYELQNIPLSSSSFASFWTYSRVSLKRTWKDDGAGHDDDDDDDVHDDDDDDDDE